MNRVIANFKTSYKQSQAQKEARKQQTEEGTAEEENKNPEGTDDGNLEFVPAE